MSAVELESEFIENRRLAALSQLLSARPKCATRSCSAGFVPRYPAVHWAYNRAVGVILLVLALPLLLVISIALIATQGVDILYRGERLGKNRKPFGIFKFRTLDSAKAAKITAGQVLPKNSNIETPLGRYLRASRLDELPQILNIVMGDMNIVGPRPVRRAIADQEEARNPHYAVRYRVTPGLVGQTQAFMSHGTDKRLRSKFNYYLCSRPVNYRSEIALFVLVGLSVLAKAAGLIGSRLFGRNSEQQAVETAQDWQLVLDTGSTKTPVVGFSGSKLTALTPIEQSEANLILRTRSGGQRVAKVRLTRAGGRGCYNVEPANSFARHCVDRYLQADAVVAPKPGWRRRRHAVRFAWDGISIVKPDLRYLDA